jgi:hypothetical protein
MPDTPVEPTGSSPYDPRLEPRVSRLESEMREMKSVLGQIVPMLARIDATLSGTLPHLATKAELSELLARIDTTLSGTLPHLATKAELSELLARIDTLSGALPHLATKAELSELRADLADKPGKTYLWAVIGVLVAAIVASYGAGLAAIALLR